MAGTTKTRLTFRKTRFFLFLHSYPYYRLAQNIREKYKFDSKLKSKDLKSRYFSKKAMPEISRLSRALNLPYKPLWNAIVLNITIALDNKMPDKDKLKIYLSIEHELIQLSIAKQNRSDYSNPDYDFEFALLSVAIERAVGNRLINIKNDSVFEYQLEILEKLYLRWYYKVAYRYKLPTMRIVPFILRLIDYS